MSITTTREGNTVTIHFTGPFNFQSRNDFINAYKDQPAGRRYVLDFKHSSAIDSSALGMLMIFREHVGEEEADITVLNCSKQVRQLFEIAQFHTIFKFR